jgi:hypothetical protein
VDQLQKQGRVVATGVFELRVQSHAQGGDATNRS